MNRLVDIGTYAFIVAGIVALTRPGSQGPNFVGAIGQAFSSILQSASGTTPSPYAQAPTTKPLQGSFMPAANVYPPQQRYS